MHRVVVFMGASLVALAIAVFLLPFGQAAPDGGPAMPDSANLLAAMSVLLLSLASFLNAKIARLRVAVLILLVTCGIVAAGASTWPVAPPGLASIAAVLGLMLLPAVVALTFLWPEGHFGASAERTFVVILWSLVAAAGLGWVLVWSPYADLQCRVQCGANPLALSSQPELARWLFDITMLGSGLGGAVAGVVCLRRTRCWAGALGALAVGAHSVARVVLDPWHSADQLETFQAVRTGALGFVGLTLSTYCIRRLVRRRRLTRLATTLDAVQPGEYSASLSRALRDPTVRIGYPVEPEGSYAHADGRRFVGAGPGQSLTKVVRAGETVAVIAHPSSLAGDLGAGLGPAAELAMDNERLQAELSVRLQALRDSRGRMITRSDRERVRLERAMHDGAQQVLLMAAHELCQAIAEDSGLEDELRPVIDDVREALKESRRIAHGIYPGILEARGLAVALQALAEEAGSFTVTAATVDRLAPHIERTVYRVVAMAVPACRGDRGTASVALRADTQGVAVEVAGCGEMPAPEWTDLEDRVGALGGTIELTQDRLVCELPCG